MTINKRLVTSGLTIAAAGAMLVGATFAFFSDAATSSGNVFSSGTLRLALCDNNESCPITPNAEQDVTATFGRTAMAPGDCTGNQTLELKNTGTVDSDSVTIAASNTDGTLAPYLRLNALTYDAVTQSVGDPNSNTWSDLSDFATNGLSGLPGLAAGATVQFVMDVCLDQSAPNGVQGLTNTLTLTVTLVQS